jgi:hypothetical protein
MPFSKSTRSRPAAPAPVSPSAPRAPLYARLRILAAVDRLIRRHGSAAAADRALMPRLHALPMGMRAAFWLSVSLSLHRRAAQAVRT